MYRDGPHFNGKTYSYPCEERAKGLLDVLRWKLTSKAQPWTPPPVAPAQPPPPTPAVGMTVTFIGHATFLVQTPKATFLIDPVFSQRASPFAWAGPKRATPPGLAYESLPPIDVVLLSHDHYDHCDLASLKALARDHAPILIAPLGYRPLLGHLGFESLVDLDWWQTHAAADWSVALVPSRHWCRRLPWDTNTRLWGGFVLRAGDRQLYFVGDSGYDPVLFPEIRARMGAPDLALIPIGAYAPRWFMADAHMNPAEAVRVHQDVGAKRSIGMHWGTFQLTDEPREEPVNLLAEAIQTSELSPSQFIVLRPGSSENV
jgi:L-ascorbate metabolism protein UlaG (beta-lactamase superfamily)